MISNHETIYQYTVIFEPAEEGGYVVHVPALPGCITEGDSLEEAREMAKDAIKGYLESLIKNNEDPWNLHVVFKIASLRFYKTRRYCEPKRNTRAEKAPPFGAHSFTLLTPLQGVV